MSIEELEAKLKEVLEQAKNIRKLIRKKKQVRELEQQTLNFEK